MRQVLLRRNQWMNVYIAELKFPFGHSLSPRLCFLTNLSVCCQPFIAFTTSKQQPVTKKWRWKGGKEKMQMCRTLDKEDSFRNDDVNLCDMYLLVVKWLNLKSRDREQKCLEKAYVRMFCVRKGVGGHNITGLRTEVWYLDSKLARPGL